MGLTPYHAKPRHYPGGAPLPQEAALCYMIRMPEFTFIHAADLHLGAPFRGLDAAVAECLPEGPSSRSLAALLTEASFTALKRLEALCLAENAAFLILSGDIYDARDGVLRARFALRDTFARLQGAGTRVFIAHGNHDPLEGGPNPVPWPDNVTVFGEHPRTECVVRMGTPLALVQGVSHTNGEVKENLALRFAPYAPGEGGDRFAHLPADLPAGIFQAAALHCAVGGAGEGHAPYAPCALRDLTRAGFDYWALGHVHQAKILSEAPLVAYAGSLQGLHINEPGPHGCQVVRVGDGGCRVRFAPLAPVIWEKTVIDCDEDGREMETLDNVADAVLDRLDEAAANGGNGPGGSGGDAPEAVFCRVVLKGHTPLDKALRKPGALPTLLERLRGDLARQPSPAGNGSRAFVWLKDIVPQTSPAVDFTELAKRDDLLGEVVRLADGAAADDDAARSLAGDALDELYAHRRLKKVLTRPEGEELRRVAESAKSLLCSLLEED